MKMDLLRHKKKKGPNMEGHSTICFFHLLSGSRGFPGAVSLSIASVDAKNTFNILNSAF